MTSKRPTLTHKRLQEILSYDPETGIFRWKAPTRPRTSPGDRAGALTASGYRILGIDKTHYKCSRLAWFYMTGQWPTQMIDHKNGDRDDDRFENLREATHQQNGWNTRARRNNRSGVRGVYWHTRAKKYAAYMCVGGRTKYLGLFLTVEEAAQARDKATEVHHGEFFVPSHAGGM